MINDWGDQIVEIEMSWTYNTLGRNYK